jgi:2-keto-4-pentenoate hydratase/2-oxohepta-3-ene-1,7-dioic acid hydratase in catechol pathway
MKIARYWDPSANCAKYGIVDGETVRELAGNPYREIVKTSNVRSLASVTLLAPCEPTKIVAGGANYHGHLKEIGLAVPTVPVFFLKPPTSLSGPGQPVVYPPQTQKLEYEGELAVVVKSPMRNTPPGEVLQNLLGYTCANDVTARDIQAIGGNLLHLCHSKSFDTFCPAGPWIETDLDPHALDIELRINGEVRQKKTNTSDMIFPVEEMVSYFSRVMTLLPGDLILTGAPPGVGGMKVGDNVEVVIQGIGTLRHTVIAGAAS